MAAAAFGEGDSGFVPVVYRCKRVTMLSFAVLTATRRMVSLARRLHLRFIGSSLSLYLGCEHSGFFVPLFFAPSCGPPLPQLQHVQRRRLLFALVEPGTLRSPHLAWLARRLLSCAKSLAGEPIPSGVGLRALLQFGAVRRPGAPRPLLSAVAPRQPHVLLSPREWRALHPEGSDFPQDRICRHRNLRQSEQGIDSR